MFATTIKKRNKYDTPSKIQKRNRINYQIR